MNKKRRRRLARKNRENSKKSKNFLILISVGLLAFALLFTQYRSSKKKDFKEKKARQYKKNLAEFIKLFGQKRYDLMDRWWKATDNVVKKFNDEETNKIWKFIATHTLPAVPIDNNSKIFGTRPIPRDKWIPIVPLIEGDEKLEFWNFHCRDSAAATYWYRSPKTIILKSFYEFTENGMAVLFLHEASHAYYLSKKEKHYDSPDKTKNHIEYVKEEIRAHTFQNRLMSFLGGKEYKDALAVKIKLIEIKYKKDGVFEFEKFVNCPLLERALLKGYARSHKERGFFYTSFYFHALFTYLDRHFSKAKSLQKKINFMRTIYGAPNAG